ncbi:T5SS/PEP-CTERM-associated repeat protein [Rhizobium laguerreae]|uniref:T5SS/PEP-CTERM-associated repeat protein n=1 Tax=Rhizobium laguerreae TaxID=1076926 RepID=A0AAX2QRN7_9HYPH|nr:T5SS/PEP-CTERM-associated repeat protein [Rhizobium laguerreae]
MGNAVRASNHVCGPFLNLRGLLAGVSAAALMALSTGTTKAAEWMGATSTDWMNASNWNGGVIPVGQAVSIASAAVPAQDEAVLGVTGPVSTSAGNTLVGVSGSPAGILTIQNGSSLTSLSARIGQGIGSNGIVTVTGSGSQWNISGGTFAIGLSGDGILNIENGGQVTTGGAGTQLGINATALGTLNVSSRGLLQTQALRGSIFGASQANFDDGILRATAVNATFISGFPSLNSTCSPAG